VDWAYDSEPALDCQETDCCLLEMGGLGIPHTDETIHGFRQNLIQKSAANSAPSNYISRPADLRCEEVVTLEHLLHGCEHYSAKIWDFLGR
jgi:hypothetical protein